MRMLERSMARFESWLTTDAGLRFRGIVMPLNIDIPANSINEMRHALRVRKNEVVTAGAIIASAWGDQFLVGNHDQTLDGQARLQRTHRLFKITRQVSWMQKVQVPDSVNPSMMRAGPPVEMGPILVAEEPMGALERDRGTFMEFERLRIVTSQPVLLGDIVDGKQVKRITVVFGLNFLEIS